MQLSLPNNFTQSTTYYLSINLVRKMAQFVAFDVRLTYSDYDD